MKYLVTGGAGFFGSILNRRLLDDGHDVVSLDLEADDAEHERLTSVRGDIRDEALLERIFCEHAGFDAVFHCAAILAHAVKDKRELWSANVDGTRTLADCCRRHGVKQFVFTSSNCVFAHDFDRPVHEREPPGPVEIYGRSKLEGERVLQGYTDAMNVVTLRTPTIIEAGRLGLLAILFQFVEEGRKVWLVGPGDNRYQFVDAGDLAEACVLAARHDRSALYHVGSDDVLPLRSVYEHLVREADTGARVASLPRGPTLFAMRLAHRLRISPLGPYHYRMIASNFVFDTTRIREDLGWRPTVTNEQMLVKAYRYYREQREAIERRRDGPAHKRAAGMGVIRVLKWLS